MYVRQSVLALVTLAVAVVFSVSSKASTIGVAVDGVAGNPVGNTLVFRPALGGNAIRYFIPLNGSSGIFGAGGTGDNGFGQVSDSGSGGGVLSMFLEFTPVSTSSASVLNVHFEDLDLAGVNDPFGFLEKVDVLDSFGTSLTGGPITNIASLFVTGNNLTQVLTLGLGVLAADPFYLRLDFTSQYIGYGTNTAEYLIAKVSPVPLPAALPLFGAGLGLLALLGWRRKRSAAA